MKDFRVTAKVTNANIQRSIEGMGYTSVPKWCKDFDFGYCTLNDYINLRLSPLGVDGQIKPTAQRLCDLLGESFDELFSEHQRDALATNRASVDVSFDQIAPLLTSDGNELLEMVYAKEQTCAINKALSTLSPRQEQILRRRFGIGSGEEETQKAVSDDFGVSVSRIQQEEQRALRNLRDPDRADALREFVGAV